MTSAKKIQTVTGDIAPSGLGFCDCHSHTYVNSEHLKTVIKGKIYMDDEDVLISRLRRFRSAGGSSLIDAQPLGAGRPAEKLRDLSFKTQVNIISATGFHVSSFYPQDHWHFSASEEKLTQLYIDELTCGMYADGDEAEPTVQTDIKAGFIKAASNDKPLGPTDEKLLRAAVNAQKETGAAIHCHTSKKTENTLMLAEHLLTIGADPERLVIAHGDSSNLPLKVLFANLLSLGVNADIDSFLNGFFLSEKDVLPVIEYIAEAGWEDRITIGSDLVGANLLDEASGGFADLPGAFRDLLLERGMPEDTLRKFFTDNPARIYSF